MIQSIADLMGPVADPRTPEMNAAQAKAMKPGLFGKIGGGNALPMVLGVLGDYFSRRPRFGTMMLQQKLAEQERAREEAQYNQQRQDRLNTPTLMNTKAGVMSVTPNGDIRTLWQAPEAPPDEPTAVSVLRAAGVDPQSPEGRAALMRSLGGYQYSPEGMDAMVQRAAAVANAQGEARARYRAPDSGGAPTGKTPPKYVRVGGKIMKWVP